MYYSVDYFINKFQAIPDELWTTGRYMNARRQCCALGHCGTRGTESGESFTEEGEALRHLFRLNGITVALINDGMDANYTQKTPKERVLAALEYIKARELSKGLNSV